MSVTTPEEMFISLALDERDVRNKYSYFKLVHSGKEDEWYFAAVKEYKFFGLTYWPATVYYAVWYSDRRVSMDFRTGELNRKDGKLSWESVISYHNDDLVVATREFMGSVAEMVIDIDREERNMSLNIEPDVYYEKK